MGGRRHHYPLRGPLSLTEASGAKCVLCSLPPRCRLTPGGLQTLHHVALWLCGLAWLLWAPWRSVPWPSAPPRPAPPHPCLGSPGRSHFAQHACSLAVGFAQPIYWLRAQGRCALCFCYNSLSFRLFCLLGCGVCPQAHLSTSYCENFWPCACGWSLCCSLGLGANADCGPPTVLRAGAVPLPPLCVRTFISLPFVTQKL